MKFTKTLITLTFLGASAGIASASMITVSTNVGVETSPFTEIFSLPGFNSTLGTLTAVNISMTVTGVPDLEVINVTGAPQSFTNGSTSTPISVAGPDGTKVNLNETATGLSGSVGAGTGGISITMFPGPTFVGSANVNAAVLADYEAAGPNTLTNSFTATGSVGTYMGTATTGVAFTGNATAAEAITAFGDQS